MRALVPVLGRGATYCDVYSVHCECWSAAQPQCGELAISCGELAISCATSRGDCDTDAADHLGIITWRWHHGARNAAGRPTCAANAAPCDILGRWRFL